MPTALLLALAFIIGILVGVGAVLIVLQKRLRDLALDRARTIAEEYKRTKDLFFSTMSHELRTPLSAILGYTDLLNYSLKDQDYGTLERDIGQIKIAGNHLLQLLDNIFDYTQIESGALSVQMKAISLPALINDVTTSVRPLIEHQRNQLQLAVDPNLDTIVTDSTKVRQVLLNLLSNAARFTTQGVVSLGVKRLPKDPRTTTDWVAFEVSDTGLGLETAQISTIIQEINHVSIAGHRQRGGTALGLALSLHLCKMLGGSMEISSTNGKGATFVVKLPLNAAPTS